MVGATGAAGVPSRAFAKSWEVRKGERVKWEREAEEKT